MSTCLIVEELKQIEKSQGGSLNHWVSGLMHLTIQTSYDLEYLTMSLSGYMNSLTKHDLLDFRHGMEYLMHHAHEPIGYSINNILKTNESPHQSFFKSGDAFKKNKEYFNCLHT